MRGKRRTMPSGVLLLGDCLSALKNQESDSVDLIFTSPPYASNRNHPYEGVEAAGYVEWFLPRSSEMLRVLNPKGSLVLNLKERVIDGERGTYVIELILAMRKQGWLWTEEYVWHKKNAFPGRWPNRFRDAWERLLHFTKSRQFEMHQDAVRVPVGDWAKRRLSRLSEADKRRDLSGVGSPFTKRVANWVGRDLVYPTNVLHFATESSNRRHSATFPLALPEHFIKLFTAEGSLVLDPFIGSGSTALAALRLGRRFLGVELSPHYFSVAAAALEAEGSRDHLPKATKRTNHADTQRDGDTPVRDQLSTAPRTERVLEQGRSQVPLRRQARLRDSPQDLETPAAG